MENNSLQAQIVTEDKGRSLTLEPVVTKENISSRIKHTMDSETELNQMLDLIINELNNCIGSVCEEVNISRSNIYVATLVGNTTMMHFLLKVPAKNIATAPFIPGITSMLSIYAKDLR